MEFKRNIPLWQNAGIEPSDELKEQGFTAGYKPPANIFNWFWNLSTEALLELRDKFNEVENTININIGKYTLTPLIAGVSVKLDVSLDYTVGEDGWRLYSGENDISGKIAIDDSFTTAPAIFESDDLHIVFEKGGDSCFITDLRPDDSGGELMLCVNKAIEGLVYIFKNYADERINAEQTERETADQKLESLIQAVSASLTDYVKKADGLPNALTFILNAASSSYNGTAARSFKFFAPETAGTSGYILKSNGSGAPTWQQSVPVANGGTGATTAAAARTNLGAAPEYSYGTDDLTAGASALETGKLYFVYE